jgi:imidazoleglycerol-phosphate dehydratase
MRSTEVSRSTNETQVNIKLNLDGSGRFEIDIPVGFMGHMLEILAYYARFDLKIHAVGDVEVDLHHIVEDFGIALGLCFSKILNDMRGIKRFGSALIPMDEALTLVALDFSGRPHLSYDVTASAHKIGIFDTELIKEFFGGFCRTAQATLHVRQLAGESAHHIFESMFKAFAFALCEASSLSLGPMAEAIPSTKGLVSER